MPAGNRKQRRGTRGPRDVSIPGFFDDFPRFRETSQTATDLGRLNLRHRAQIEANRKVLDGARVLDIASHDGRWAFAALRAGATHVTGIEARPDLVAHSEETFRHYGVEDGMYRFVAQDIFAALEREDLDVDVVMCFGFLYHTLRYPELFAKIRKLGAEHLLLDTKVSQGNDRTIRVTADEVAREAHAARDDYTYGTRTLVGAPTKKALKVMLRVYGYGVEEEQDWAALAAEAGGGDVPPQAIRQYTSGQRVTWRCRYDEAVLPPSLPAMGAPSGGDGDDRDDADDEV